MASSVHYENAAGETLSVTTFSASGNVRSGDAKTNYRIDGKKVAKAVGLEFIKTATKI